MGGSRAQKADYFEKLRVLLNEYKSLFIVGYLRFFHSVVL
jgi:ribosomal protein L10